jgi:hypothetical protein
MVYLISTVVESGDLSETKIGTGDSYLRGSVGIKRE